MNQDRRMSAKEHAEFSEERAGRMHTQLVLFVSPLVISHSISDQFILLWSSSLMVTFIGCRKQAWQYLVILTLQITPVYRKLCTANLDTRTCGLDPTKLLAALA